jgi:GNAT superfamily N-acetyltransferase
LKAGFEPILEEDVMVYRGKGKNFRVCDELNIVVNDGSLLGVWTDVSMKGFGVSIVFRDALLDMYGKASKFKGTRSYLGFFQGKPAGSCGLVSFDNVGGIFSVGTAPEFRKKGIATALLLKAVADSLTLGNSMLYLITTKGSDAERLYMSLGFEVAYSHYRYEFHPSTG